MTNHFWGKYFLKIGKKWKFSIFKNYIFFKQLFSGKYFSMIKKIIQIFFLINVYVSTVVENYFEHTQSVENTEN